MDPDVMVVGGVADDPFAIDVAHFLHQGADIADLLSYKTFANSEFCPRFIRDENDMEHIGGGLENKTVVLISTCCGEHTRNARAMRNFLLARAAKDNGARRVVLVEPDLFYSAQDRGPRPDHGETSFQRTTKDYKKFDGQPFSSRLYAQLLRSSGVDEVMTVHNHSISVQRLFEREFNGHFTNLDPSGLYADYLAHHPIMEPRTDDPGFILCAPDRGATPFVAQIHERLRQHTGRMLLKSEATLLLMDKERSGERRVDITIRHDSPTAITEVQGRDVVVADDMIRTGSTILRCCRHLKKAGARRVMFMVTHFYSSPEVKENLNDPAIDEIVTTNTLPAILNRDMQGRLRKKMLVLKVEKWIANVLRRHLYGESGSMYEPPYTIDVSSKNPLWHPVHALSR